MNGRNDAGRSGTLLAGKEFVIVMVVFFSSLSFTLGFFVGKKSAGGSGDQAIPAVQPVAQSVVPQGVPPREMPPEKADALPAAEITPAEPDGESRRVALPSPPSSEQAVERAFGPEDGKPSPQNSRLNRMPKTPSRETAGVKTPSAVTAAPHPQRNSAAYAVQLGALKNEAEARRLKEKFARKGYKTYITVTGEKRKEKIYKVKAGEFRDRRDAELLALRLKKNERLHAFVTLRNE
jgi:cell division septation protein DedD